jgi:hypothetical protein
LLKEDGRLLDVGGFRMGEAFCWGVVLTEGEKLILKGKELLKENC